MNRHNLLVASAFVVLLGLSVTEAQVTSWKGIELLKSKRTDVERALGAPLRETRSDGGLHFNVAGGKVTVFFVTPQFIASKKLAPELEGTVLQIVLQHERASDSPASLGLDKDKKFERDASGDVSVYRNLKDGLSYTFVRGRLVTTRYSVPTDQLAKHFKRK